MKIQKFGKNESQTPGHNLFAIKQMPGTAIRLTFVPEVEQVIFNPPRTIINWSDGTKTIVKVMEGDEFDEHVGFQAAVIKKVFGGHSQYKRLIENAVRAKRKWRVLGENETIKIGDVLHWPTCNPDILSDGWLWVGKTFKDVKSELRMASHIERKV